MQYNTRNFVVWENTTTTKRLVGELLNSMTRLFVQETIAQRERDRKNTNIRKIKTWFPVTRSTGALLTS